MTTPDPPPPPDPPDTPPPDPEEVPVLLAGQEEYLRAEVGRHR